MISKHSKIPPDSLEEANYSLHPRPYSDNARSARLLNPASLFPTTLKASFFISMRFIRKRREDL